MPKTTKKKNLNQTFSNFMNKFGKWMVEILKDNNGKPSINRPFYLLFMLGFIGFYFYLTYKTQKFPDIPSNTFPFIGLLLGYEAFKKIMISMGNSPQWFNGSGKRKQRKGGK